MSSEQKTVLDSIDWDAMAQSVLDVFNHATAARNQGYFKDNNPLIIQAAAALAQVSAEQRAQREAAARKLSRSPIQPQG